jgi:hypothetical protein
MITYENGQREIFNKISETSAPSAKRPSATNCAKKLAFGVDVGLGGSFFGGLSRITFFAPALGIRVMSHFNPYFGVDFLKVNWITDVYTPGVNIGYLSYTPWTMRLQFMPGIRGNSPAFYTCMSAYAAFR